MGVVMEESMVYGYIKGPSHSTASDSFTHNTTNRQALMSLPTMDSWPFLPREMFSLPRLITHEDRLQSSVIHFGGAYKGIEYEWKEWIAKFETLLQQMYWHSVVVHLETELSGVHTFTWGAGGADHLPGEDPLNIRCEWQHELGLAGRRA